MRRIRDKQLEKVPGHPEGLAASWPVTGHWCEGCGYPLHQALEALGSHPLCLSPIQAGTYRPRALAIEKKGGTNSQNF